MIDGSPHKALVYGYNAEEYNPATDMQYLRARYYSVSTGRFISRDTYLGAISVLLTLNRYAYTSNNPVNFIDPSGHTALFGGQYPSGMPSEIYNMLAEQKGVADYERDQARVGTVGTYERPEWAYPTITSEAKTTWWGSDPVFNELYMSRSYNNKLCGETGNVITALLDSNVSLYAVPGAPDATLAWLNAKVLKKGVCQAFFRYFSGIF